MAALECFFKALPKGTRGDIDSRKFLVLDGLVLLRSVEQSACEATQSARLKFGGDETSEIKNNTGRNHERIRR